MKKFKYQRIRDDIVRTALRNKTLRLPSEREIHQRYGVSLTTAKKALQTLDCEKLVSREVGRGTFLISSKLKTTLRLLMPESHLGLTEYFEDEIKLYERQNPGVEIELLYFEGKGLRDFIHQAPGAKILYAHQFASWARDSLLAPLDQFVDYHNALAHLNTQYLNMSPIAGRGLLTFFMPILYNVNMFGYNKLYAEILGLDAENGPSDWEELLLWTKASRELHRRNSYRYGTCLRNSRLKHQYAPMHFYFNLSKGEDLIQVCQGEAKFNFKYGHEWIDLFRLINSNGSIYQHQKSDQDPLLMGKTLFSPNLGTWVYSHLRHLRSEVPIKLMPVPPSETGNLSFPRVGKGGLALLNDPSLTIDEKKAAWEFIKYFVTDLGAQERLVQSFSCLSANSEIFERQKRQTEWRPFIEAMAIGTHRVDHPAWTSVYHVVSKYFYAAMEGRISVSEAVSQIEEFCPLLLEIEKERV